MRRLGARLPLLLGAVGFGWLGVELLARLFLGPPAPALPPLLFFTSPNWQLAEGGSWLHYGPDAQIRSVAVYGDRIEYDVRFRSNDLGFVDHREYGAADATAERSLAFVGDSFTAGFHGGTPWLPRLRDRLRADGARIALYNLGVGGTGFRHFLPLLRSVSRRLAFDEVVFLFVDDDLDRFLWRPVRMGGAIVVCPLRLAEARCAARPAWIRVLSDPEATGPEVEALARERAPPWAQGLRGRLLRQSFVLGALRRDGAPIRDPRARPIDLERWLALLPAALAGRQAAFLQIPERHELQRGAYDRDLAPAIRAAGHRFVSLLEECGFERDHYFPIDPHFNAGGYAVLETCVARVLALP